MSNTKQDLPKMVLIDGSSFLFRAFYALPALKSPSGLPTGAIYGVINMLQKLVAEHQPQKLAVIFDPKGPNFRHQLFPDYKANRSQMPEDLRLQIEPLFELIELLGYPLLIESGVEADDVIGTLCHRHSEDYQLLIATGDKDITQLIGPWVTIMDTMKGVEIDGAYVEKKFGVRPNQMIDFLALAGDSSDNIPGVSGVGPKTAAKWLQQYETLDNLLSNAEDIKGKAGEKLRAAEDDLPLYRQLVTIKTDVVTEFSTADMTIQSPKTPELIQQFKTLGFERLVKAFDQGSTSIMPADGSHRDEYEVIDTLEKWQGWFERLSGQPVVAIDTETTSLDALNAELVGVSFCSQAGQAAYLPLSHVIDEAKDRQLSFDEIKNDLKSLLENPAIKKVGQNLKYDIKVLHQHGMTVNGIFFDTLIGSYLLDSEGRHSLDQLTKKYLGIEMISYEQVMANYDKGATFRDVALEKATVYAAEDADMTWRLYEYLSPKIDQEPSLANIFFQQEMPLVSILAEMEISGILVDVEMLATQGQSLREQSKIIEDEIYQAVGQTFNIASTKQLQAILFDQLQLPVIKKTPKGQPSTAEDVLVELGYSYDLPRQIVKYRHVQKLLSTYVDKLPQQVDSKSHRVHTTYQQTVTSTGRLSSVGPNLQNIPIRTEEGRKIRQAFIAENGFALMAADYSQVELRIMAHLSGDEALVAAFAEGEDVHVSTAAEVFSTPKVQVTAEQRRSAKAINFGLIYGMSAFGLAKQLRINRSEAQTYVDRYFERFPGVLHYMESTREMAKETGYVETLLGRKMYLPQIQAANGRLRQAAERAAINAPMQGTAADLIKRAMIAIDARIKQEFPNCRSLLQVHDELVFEVPLAQVETFRMAVKQAMEGAMELTVPLLVEIGVGSSWDNAH